MRILLAAAILMIAAPLFAQPSDILVYHDTYGGYGDAVITAINNLWPSCNVADHTGGEAGMTAFNTDLYSQHWDIIIAECWYYDTDDLDWMALNDLYDTNVIYASCWELDGGTSGQSDLYTSMGISSVTPVSGSVSPHYAWQPSHPICDGITDWSWENPGLGTLNARFTVSDAEPVTGWTSSSQTGEAGICVANDGVSVISGYTPGYALMDEDIRTNLLQFMADDEALVPATWGSIKANGIN